VIRRFYILPLKPGVSVARVERFVRALDDADRFIPGLIDSSAGVDVENRTVVWENTFVDEATYSGPYMVHPYHIATIDDFVMADSPSCLTQDIVATRYQLPGAIPKIPKGIRRLVLVNISDGSDVAPLEALAVEPDGMATSVLRPDDVGWVSAKGRPWTHIWEQGFTDPDALQRYLQTRDGVVGSSKEGIGRLGVELEALKILSCPFELKSAEAQSPPPMRPDAPILCTITARTSVDDADAYLDLLERYYDPSVANAGGTLLHRWRSVDQAYAETEFTSTWRVDSLAAYSDLRARTYFDPDWNRFVRDAMPLVRGGTRRFYRET
jgi:hypothetical protein